ncbi:hypothetical protein [Deinococcus radiodurans]|nr:hypothetical protein [Deinococcus radiodurans]UTA51143.1 hypothetical protein MSS93_02145 [Deinococcus radiodurans]
MKRLLQWTMLTALVAGTASAADVRLGLNTSATLGCEVAGVRAGVQEGRFGGYIQGSYCTSNVQGESGAGAFGGGLTVDFYQSLTLNAYGQLGAVSQPNGNPSIYGGVGVRYGIPLVPVEAYLEGGVSHRSTIIGGLTAPRFALGLNYVWRGVNLNEISGGESRPSNISAPGTGGLNVDASGSGTGGSGGAPAPTQCNVSPEADAAAARSAADAAARSALSSAATAYSAIYSNVSYDISVGNANVNGNSATVTGTITLRATNRTNGEPVSGTYSGVVTLSRSGCGWVATGYRQNGE